MTGVLFGGLLLLTVACWLKLRDDDVRPIAIAILAAVPLLLFGAIVIYAFAKAPAGEYRVALEAVEFDLSADRTSVTVGGGTDGEEADDLIVRDLPPGYLTFRVDGDHVSATLPAELDQSVENPTYAAVRVDDEKPFANSVAIRNGSRIDIDGFGSAAPVIPRREQKITERIRIPILRNLNAQTVTYPLRFQARAKNADGVVTGPDGAPLGSFLSHEGGFFRSTLFLTLTGDGTSAGSARYSPNVAIIEAAKPRRFALFRLDYADPNAAGEGRSIAQERRSFRASFDKGRLRIVFDTPDIVRLAPDRIAPLLEKGAFRLATRDPRRDAPVVANQMVLAFPQLGPRVQNELFSAIHVSESGDCRVRVTTHTGTTCFAPGDAFRIGDRAAAIVRITRIATPWGLIATIAILALVSFTWMRRHESDVVGIIIVSAAEVLLAVRLLIAFEGALLDPASAAGLWESLVVFALVPLTLRVGRMAAKGTLVWTKELLIEAAAIVAVVAVALVRAHVGIGTIAIIAAAVVVIPIAAAWLANGVIDRVSAMRWSLRKLIGFAVLVAAIRLLLLGALGWKERISLPLGDLALTIVYLPVVFLFFALVWARYRESAAPPTRRRVVEIIEIVGIVAAGILLTVLVSALVKDSGSALVHVPAIVLLFALPLFARVNRTTLALALPLVGVILIHIVVALMPHLRGQDRVDPAFEAALRSEADADAFMTRRLGQSTNQLRVLSSVAPHQLEQAGTSKAEGLVMQRRMLDRYTGTGLAGAGYLHVPLATFLDTHMNDNLSAIHVMAPFGIAGIVGLLALLSALALAPLRAHFADVEEESPERAIDTRAAIGILALWTFSLCGLYMIAANLGLVLFTGKNVYLLAATSNSDAIEGGVLLLIALVALVRRTPAEPAA